MKIENPFPYPTPLVKYLLKELINQSNKGSQRGWCEGGSGNFSVSGLDQIMWQSPSGVDKSKLTPGQFVPTHILSAQPCSPLSAKISDEAPLHAGIYCHYPQVKTVLHFHLPEVVKKTQTLSGDLVISHHEMIKAFGIPSHTQTVRVPVIDNSQDMIALGRRFAEVANPQVSILILKGHGAYGWGSSPSAVAAQMEALEFLCRQ